MPRGLWEQLDEVGRRAVVLHELAHLKRCDHVVCWLAGIVGSDRKEDWGALNSDRTYLIVFAVFILALLGIPPFPGFWAKWELVTQLLLQKAFVWLAVILLGSLFEVIYLLKWLGISIKS